MTIADTSREAYARHWKRMDTLRFQVYYQICIEPGLDDITIARTLRKDINSITPRIGELIKAGLVRTDTGPNIRGNNARRTYPR